MRQNDKMGWAALVLLAAGLTACSKPVPQAEPVRAVKTQVLAAAAPGGVREWAAEVRARVDTPLGFQVGGRLVRRQAELGQSVQAGQVLAQLDARDLELGHVAAQAQLAAAQTQYEQAQSDFKRFQELQAKGFISAAELERRQVALRAAESQRDQARAQAGVQGHQAGYATLTASAAGIVTAVLAEPGQVLGAGTPVLRLALDGPRDVVFNVAEQDQPVLRQLQGQAGAVQVRLWGEDEAQVHAATVREVAGAAEAATRTFVVKADLGALAVRPGQTATVRLPAAPTQDAALRVPLPAVTQREGRTVVWVLDGQAMTVQPRPVQLAAGEGSQAVIASGVAAGDEIVTAGVHVLTPGQKVRRYEGAR